MTGPARPKNAPSSSASPGSYGITTPTPTAPAWPALRRPAAWAGLGGLGVSGASRASPVKAPWPKVSSPPRTGARPPAGARPPPPGRTSSPSFFGAVQRRLSVALILSSDSATESGPRPTEPGQARSAMPAYLVSVYLGICDQAAPLWGTSPYIMCPPTRQSRKPLTPKQYHYNVKVTSK